MTLPLSLSIPQDRALAVPAGHVIKTAHVPVHKVKLASTSRMAVGDVAEAFQKRLTIGPNSPWPCPNGVWDDDGYFVIHDGRHEYVATLMLGFRTILVAWVSLP